ncbi:carboxypeptidase regulatory-like domain-containing protein [candidate division WOR-3 bacterium]|nr:carboxypeptidase regulatory-like domain-containing protein [candidate division WOR-3 bacterium]
MKNISILAITVLAFFAFSSCTKDSSPTQPTNAGCIDGYFRLPSGGMPVPGATVTAGNITTTTGSDGYFFLQNVSAGDQVLTATKGVFTASATVTVVKNDTASRTLNSSVPTSGYFLVVYGGDFWDELTGVLKTAGITYDSVRLHDLNASHLNQRKYVFLLSDSGYVYNNYPSDLKTWAEQQGNYLYVSGNAYFWLQNMFPGKFEVNAPTGVAGTATSVELDSELSAYTGGTIAVVFAMPFPPISMVQTGTTVLIRATVPLQGGQWLSESPVAFRWKEGGTNGGTITFTNFYTGMKGPAEERAKIYLSLF